LDKMVPHTHVF